MKFLVLFILTSYASLFAQTLKFDVMIKFSTLSDNSTNERSVYGISSNNNYVMQVLNQPDGQQVAQVYDLRSLKKHEFSISELKSENEIKIYKFIYSNTTTVARIPPKDIYFDFQSVSTEGEIETVKLIFYKNKSKTKPTNVLELKIMKSEANFFPIFRFTYLNHLEFMTELNYINAGLVTNCIYENGKKKYTLKAFEEANLELTIPN